jgi:hypothetical protein
MAQSLESICQQVVKNPKLVANCNEFIMAVATKVGSEYNLKDMATAFAGNANSIRDRFGTAGSTVKPFIYIGKDPYLATRYATEGHFVVGGLTSTEMTYMYYIGKDKHQNTATMGHLVVVVPGGPSRRCEIKLMNGETQSARGGYPYCYQGAHKPQYRFTEKTQVDAVFPRLLLNKVVYAYIPLKMD